MNRSRKIIIVMLAALILLFTFTACSGGNSALVGTWEYSHSISLDNGEIGDSPLAFHSAYEHIDTITFYKDGTFSTVGKPHVQGNYEIINDGTAVKLTWDAEYEVFDFKQQSNNVHFSGGAYQVICVFVKK